MPELPEVETFVRNLRGESSVGQHSILGCELRQTEFFGKPALTQPSRVDWAKVIPGQTIQKIHRRGKYLLVSLDQDFIIIHLGMSGDLKVENGKIVENPDGFNKHDRAVFYLSDGWRLIFNDPRKFGHIWITGSPQDVIGKLGPEPLDAGFTSDEFYRRFQKHHKSLKPLLMEQTFLAGLGNIYTDEALFRARLHPLMACDRLTPLDCEVLLASIRTVLEEGIRRNGASIDWVYRGGSFQNTFQVYQRTGKPCLICGTPIQRLVVGQRGTHICPKCQSLERG